MITDASEIVDKMLGRKYTAVPHHNFDAYCKSDYKNAVENIFLEKINQSKHHRIRAYGDINRALFSYYALAINRAELKYVNRSQSSRLLPYKHNFKKYLKSYNPELFCINDNQHVTDNQRIKIKPFLDSIFSVKSQFEK